MSHRLRISLVELFSYGQVSISFYWLNIYVFRECQEMEVKLSYNVRAYIQPDDNGHDQNLVGRR